MTSERFEKIEFYTTLRQRFLDKASAAIDGDQISDAIRYLMIAQKAEDKVRGLSGFRQH